eukprot:8036834-Alexandrium_andersonii.AAC.1
MENTASELITEAPEGCVLRCLSRRCRICRRTEPASALETLLSGGPVGRPSEPPLEPSEKLLSSSGSASARATAQNAPLGSSRDQC